MTARSGALTEGSSFFVVFIITNIIIIFFTWLSHAVDTITPGATLSNNGTLVSAGGVFELGFFGDASSGNLFLGIWPNANTSTNEKAVWVANRENPLLDSCFLQIRYDGNLILMDQRQTPVIVNSRTLATSPNTSATLLDSGNFVLRQGDSVIWKSFDYPSDTFLPGMKLGWFGLNSSAQPTFRVLTSWASPLNPSNGAFTLGVVYESPQLVVYRGDSAHLDIGYWEQNHFVFENSSSNNFNFSYVSNQNETYFTFSNVRSGVVSWLVMDSTGNIDEYTMINRSISMVSHSLCEGSAAVNASVCLPSLCNDGGSFSVINGSLPAPTIVNGSISIGFSDCESMCASNCSCSAFASVANDQTGCQLYYGNRDDLLNAVERGGSGLVYVRGNFPGKTDGRKKLLWLILLGSLVLLVPIFVSLWCYIRRNRKLNQVRSQDEASGSAEVTIPQMGTNNNVPSATELEFGGEKDQDLPLFSFSTIEAATNCFAIANVLGEGGFGPVYKGKLPQGQEIAVKRLSKRSGQGLKEFMNEVSLISKLQHRNLVRLLGCCIQGEENILVYEYMPNRSLDSFIFDSTKRVQLDWRKRAKIIEGVAQGLLYLHKYSRLRIIHRDLKTSNILLDGGMTPKISDFGMARIFGEHENRARTNKIVGTFGYMSPEYAMDGLFSEKSDVFSFGIVLLEILSGKKNVAFFELDQSENLLSYAWNLWKEGRSIELVDPTMANQCSSNEAIRYVELCLWCVQERAADRPNMQDVVLMLSNVKTTAQTLPHLPKQPSLLTYSGSTSTDDSSRSNQAHSSQSVLSISVISAR